MGFFKRLFGKKEKQTEENVPRTKEKEVVEEDVRTESKKENNGKPKKYHVSQNKDEKSENYKAWRVRKEGSNKTIKYFKTQKEAIEYAENLAESSGSSVVIHKVDGSIRKQDYSK